MKNLVLLVLLLPGISVAQTHLTGYVLDDQGESLPGATVQLTPGNHGTITDLEGKFVFKVLPHRSYSLQISSIGFESFHLTISHSPTSEPIRIKLKTNVQELSAVEVSSNREAIAKKLSGLSVNVLNVGNLQDLNLDVNQILGTMSGVNIREKGGLGSGFSMSLNGLTGNQVRYFIDEVPMEFYGAALTLNNLPANLIETIQVYKGVLPINLTSDALGGGINIVTSSAEEDVLDLTYSFGSFNTHRASLVAQKTLTPGVLFRLTSFYNYSDNDYEMKDVPVIDDFGNVLGTESAKRFHDAYFSGSVRGQLRILNQKWADQLTIGATYGANNKEIQHTEVSINRVYGGLHTKSKSYIGNISHRKSWQNFTWKNDLAGGRSPETTYDTLMQRFNWRGEPKEINTAEYFSEPSILELTNNFLWARSGGVYTMHPQHTLSTQISMNYLRRTGKDEINPRVSAQLSPNFMNKTFFGLSYNFHTSDDQLKTFVFLKQYWFQAEIHTDEYVGNETEVVSTSSSLSRTGYGLAVSYSITPALLAKTSYEHAYRLPESHEIMGNGVLILPNANINPENSHNINLGLIYEGHQWGGNFKSELTGFYRPVRDKIWRVAQGVLSSYQNIAKTRVIGLETSNTFNFQNQYLLTMNLTYQKHTDQRKFNEGLENTEYGNRLPNDPYFFGGLSAQYRRNLKSSRLSFIWRTRYVHSFYLYAESNGNQSEKRQIPTQLINDFNVNYTLQEGTYNVSLAVNNLFDQEAYDNWSLQKPGRSYSIKLRYFITK